MFHTSQAAKSTGKRKKQMLRFGSWGGGINEILSDPKSIFER